MSRQSEDFLSINNIDELYPEDYYSIYIRRLVAPINLYSLNLHYINENET
jgi:hypothetical protein